MLKKNRKHCAPIKEHKKKREEKSMTTSKIKASGESQSKECLEKRSSCMTSFVLDPVFGSQHHVAQESLILILPKAPHTSHRSRELRLA
jgi:hypothetical protein